jgi:hypothetical protein
MATSSSIGVLRLGIIASVLFSVPGRTVCTALDALDTHLLDRT